MSDFVIRRWQLEHYPGDQAPPHVHHHADEAFCVLRGHLEVLLHDTRRRLGPGEFVTVPAGTTHTFATVDDAGAEVLVVMAPEVDQLVTALHAAATEQERATVWARYRSEVVDRPGPEPAG